MSGAVITSISVCVRVGGDRFTTVAVPFWAASRTRVTVTEYHDGGDISVCAVCYSAW